MELPKLSVKCRACEKLWLVGDRERTEEEKAQWMCPYCEEDMSNNMDELEFHNIIRRKGKAWAKKEIIKH